MSGNPPPHYHHHYHPMAPFHAYSHHPRRGSSNLPDDQPSSYAPTVHPSYPGYPGSSTAHDAPPPLSDYSPERQTSMGPESYMVPPPYAHPYNSPPRLPPPPTIHHSPPTIHHPATAGSPLVRRPSSANRQASTASAQSLLGDVAAGTNEFDLFNGELLDTDPVNSPRNPLYHPYPRESQQRQSDPPHDWSARAAPPPPNEDGSRSPGAVKRSRRTSEPSSTAREEE